MDTTRRLPANRREQEVDGLIAVQGRIDRSLSGDDGVMELPLFGSEIDQDGLRFSLREFADVAPKSPVHQTGKRVKPLNIPYGLYASSPAATGVVQRVVDILKPGIFLEDRLAPRRCGRLEQCGPGLICPLIVALSGDQSRFIDVRIWLGDRGISGLVDDHVGT